MFGDGIKFISDSAAAEEKEEFRLSHNFYYATNFIILEKRVPLALFCNSNDISSLWSGKRNFFSLAVNDASSVAVHFLFSISLFLSLYRIPRNLFLS